MAIIQIITNEAMRHPMRGEKRKLAAALLAAALLMLLAATTAYSLSTLISNSAPSLRTSYPISEAVSQPDELHSEDTAGEAAAAVLPIPGTGSQQAQFTTPLKEDSSEAEAGAQVFSSEGAEAEDNPKDSALQDFQAAVINGEAGQITGVFVPGVLALRIVSQPANLPGYISTEESVATYFGMSAKYGSIGLLAHNFLAGATFFNVSVGQTITLIYGDGRTSVYLVTAVRRFQALSPNSPYSAFLDLDNGNQYLSTQQVFSQTYGRSSVLILQTCIEADGIQTWGRFFVIAEPVGDS